MIGLFILSVAINLAFLWLFAGGYEYIAKWGEGLKDKLKRK